MEEIWCLGECLLGWWSDVNFLKEHNYSKQSLYTWLNVFFWEVILYASVSLIAGKIPRRKSCVGMISESICETSSSKIVVSLGGLEIVILF